MNANVWDSDKPPVCIKRQCIVNFNNLSIANCKSDITPIILNLGFPYVLPVSPMLLFNSSSDPVNDVVHGSLLKLKSRKISIVMSVRDKL